MVMPKTPLYTPSLSVIFIILLAVSCVPGSCFEETNAFVKATFYSDSTGLILTPDSLSLYATGRDTSLIYNRSANVKPALLPLDASTGECSFVIKINGVPDTLTFSYSSYPHLLSKECGYTFFHTIEDPVYTTNIIDTITVTKNTITTQSEENIRIYF